MRRTAYAREVEDRDEEGHVVLTAAYAVFVDGDHRPLATTEHPDVHRALAFARERADVVPVTIDGTRYVASGDVPGMPPFGDVGWMASGPLGLVVRAVVSPATPRAAAHDARLAAADAVGAATGADVWGPGATDLSGWGLTVRAARPVGAEDSRA